MINYNFFEFEDLLEVLNHDYFLGDSNIDVVKVFLSSVIRDLQKSEHFSLIDPSSVNKSTSISQCRTINIDINNKREIKNSAERNGVTCPILCAQDKNSDYLYELYNGRHRLESMIEINKKLSSVKLIPAIIVPCDLKDAFKSCLIETQAILNEKLSYATNNDNDMSKSLRNICERDNIDLSKSSDYDKLLKKAEILYRHKSTKSIRNNLTRIKNSIARETSDVYCAKPKEFVDTYRMQKIRSIWKDSETSSDTDYFYKTTDKIKNMEIRAVSMKGSSFDQEWTRSTIFKSENSDKKLTWLYSDNSNKGDSGTVIGSRKNFYNKIYKTCIAFENQFGKKDLPFDQIIISPQIQSEFSFQFDGIEYSSLRESRTSPDSWIEVSKKDLLDAFANKKSYKKDWIFREKKTAHLTVVND